MNILSLFDGISCGKVALQRANIPVESYYASEIDKYAVAVSKYNHHDIIQLGNIRNWQEWQLPHIDMIIGGSPCQGFSNAGKGLNFADERSKLFFVFVDIIKALKPKYFLLENVRMKQEWQDVISEYMEVKPILIDSALVSAQSRKRLYWANIPDIIQPVDKCILLQNIVEEDVDKSLYKSDNWIKWLNNKPSEIQKGFVSINPRKANTLQARMYASWRGNYIQDSFGIRQLTPIECERLQTLPDNYTQCGLFDDTIKQISNSKRYKMLGNGWTVDVIAHILSFIKKE